MITVTLPRRNEQVENLFNLPEGEGFGEGGREGEERKGEKDDIQWFNLIGLIIYI